MNKINIVKLLGKLFSWLINYSLKKNYSAIRCLKKDYINHINSSRRIMNLNYSEKNERFLLSLVQKVQRTNKYQYSINKNKPE